MPRQPRTTTKSAKNSATSTTSMSKLTSTGSPASRRASGGSRAQEETRDALYQRAAALGINGRSRMTREALANAIRDHEQGRR